jgi:hypothetical protein
MLRFADAARGMKPAAVADTGEEPTSAPAALRDVAAEHSFF